MTLKDMMKKVETFNEIATQIGADTARLYFQEGIGCGEWFETWAELRKHIRREYVSEYAEVLLKADAFEINGTTEIEWTNKFEQTYEHTIETAIETRRYW